MHLSYRNKRHNKIDYFPLPNGNADVFLHKNGKINFDEEGNKSYVAEEVYFTVNQNITKEIIEENFDKFWENKGEVKVMNAGVEERLEMAEDTINFLLGL